MCATQGVFLGVLRRRTSLLAPPSHHAVLAHGLAEVVQRAFTDGLPHAIAARECAVARPLPWPQCQRRQPHERFRHVAPLSHTLLALFTQPELGITHPIAGAKSQLRARPRAAGGAALCA